MNSRERLFNAIEGKTVDRVPVAPFVMGFAARFAGIPYGKYCTNYREMADAQIKTVLEFGYDIVTADTDAYREAEACGAILEFQEDGLPLEVQPALLEKTDLTKWDIPVIEASPRMYDKVMGVQELKNRVGGQFPVLGWVEAPFQSASILRNISFFMMDLFDDPEFVKEILGFSTEMALSYGKAQVKAGADIIGIGDAVASLISPDDYASYVVPYTTRLIKELKELGVKVKYHICGQSSHLLEHITKLGADIVNVDSQVDLSQARKILGETCIKGNLDPVKVLKDGTPERIKAEVHKAIEIAGNQYIVSPGCEVPIATPHNNFHAMVLAASQASHI